MHLKAEDIEAVNYDVYDKDTDMRIPGVLEANDETGELTLVLVAPNGRNYICNKEGDPVKFKFKANIEIRKKP